MKPGKAPLSPYSWRLLLVLSSLVMGCATSPNLYQTPTPLPVDTFQLAFVAGGTYVDEVCGRVLNADGGLSRDCVSQGGSIATETAFFNFPAVRVYYGLADNLEIGGQLGLDSASFMVKKGLVDTEYFDLSVAPALVWGSPTEVTLPLLFSVGTRMVSIYGSVAPLIAYDNLPIGSKDSFEVVVFGGAATLGLSLEADVGVFIRPEVGFTFPIAALLLPDQTATLRADWFSVGMAVGWTVSP